MENSQDNKFPIFSKQAGRLIQGKHTEVLATSFTDKILILITQYGKVGSLIQTCVDQQSISANPMSTSDLASTSSNFLLGAGSSGSKKTQLYQVYASHISQMIKHQSPEESRPVILSLALSIQEPDASISLDKDQELEQRKQDRDLFENAIELVNECRVW